MFMLIFLYSIDLKVHRLARDRQHRRANLRFAPSLDVKMVTNISIFKLVGCNKSAFRAEF
ncbi:TPA: hypothetical protein I7791_03740 [Vibrio vulnificus]|nr:hypothetical protein [Vibrio vulnificus]